MTAWEYPKLEKEAKLLFTDDLAGLYSSFGYQVLDDAIEWHRQHAEKGRPSIGKIREQCEAHRGPRRPNGAELEHLAYIRDYKAHPEKYVPVDECIKLGMKLGTIAKQRRVAGNPMSESEYSAMKARMTAEMNASWLKELRDDKQPKVDTKVRAAGA